MIRWMALRVVVGDLPMLQSPMLQPPMLQSTTQNLTLLPCQVDLDPSLVTAHTATFPQDPEFASPSKLDRSGFHSPLKH